MGGPKQRGNAAWRNTLGIQLAGVRQTLQVRAGGTGRRSTMDKFCNGFSAMPDGFSAASMDELDQVEGGQTSMSWYRGRTVGEAVQSFVNEATARYQALKEK